MSVPCVCVCQSVYGKSSRASQRPLSTFSDENDEVDGLEAEPAAEPGADGEAGGGMNVSVPVAESSRSSTSEFSVRHVRVTDWPAGRAFPADPDTLLTLHAQLAECRLDRTTDRVLVHCLYVSPGRVVASCTLAAYCYRRSVVRAALSLCWSQP